ncbi:MAG: hypothetical protein U0793_05980 [Gemmataceae bacterium]
MTSLMLNWLFLPLLAADIPDAPGPAATPIAVKTFYEGVLAYKPHPTGCYVRGGPAAEKKVKVAKAMSDRDASFAPFKRTPAVIALHKTIGVSVTPKAPPEQVWEAARDVLKWFHEHARHDNDKYKDLTLMGRPAKSEGWPTVEQIARYHAAHGELAYAACFSEAHLVFQLFRVCGLPTEDFGIASARYVMKDDPKAKPEHVYLGLRVGGDWYYIDPSAKLPPPYLKRASVGRSIGVPPGCDYAHPHEFVVVQGARFQAIPLLAPVPDVLRGGRDMFRSRWAGAMPLAALLFLAAGNEAQSIDPAPTESGAAADVAVDPAIVSLKVNVKKLSATKAEVEFVGVLRNNGVKTFKSGKGQQAVRLYAYPALSFGGSKGTVLLEREFTTLKAGRQISYRYTMTWDARPGVGHIAYDYVFQIDYDPDIRMDGNGANDDADLTNNRKTVRYSEIVKKVNEALGK